MMSGTVMQIGAAPDGDPIHEIVLTGPDGTRARVLSWGATLRDLEVPGSGGVMRRVVLGYDDLSSYLANPAYLGATCGRVANRIRNGRFTLNGRGYELARNERGVTHLHGGTRGFSHRPWRVETAAGNAVTLAYRSADGEEGYPGTLDVLCTYRLVAPSTLEIEMTARTDAPTPVSLAHHSYFTLDPGHSVRELEVAVAARHYTPVDADQIPTGEIAPVDGTPFDLRSFRRLADQGIGFDTNFVLDDAGPPAGDPAAPRLVARARSSRSGMAMEVRTTAPGLQLYDGAHLPVTNHGIGALTHGAHAGICFEPQYFPDAVNRLGLPPPWITPDAGFRQVTAYRFCTDNVSRR
ncbi:aldose epimerase family protein [Ancylobacter moscoviensis]|nr:aldose epimerase family protein [Ancylobacter moscoviensis]